MTIIQTVTITMSQKVIDYLVNAKQIQVKEYFIQYNLVKIGTYLIRKYFDVSITGNY